MFNYPETCEPRLVQVQPWFDDNCISLSQKENQMCWVELVKNDEGFLNIGDANNPFA